jgi:AraC-like DNA-binding protein
MSERALHPSHLVGPLLRYARAQGERLDLAQFGLSDAAFERDASPISNPSLGALFDALAGRLDEPHLGLVLPAQLQFQGYALPELAARASATLRAAFQQWARYAALLHPSVSFSFEESAGVAHFSHHTLGYPRGLSRHLNEFALAAAVHFSRETSGFGPVVCEVHFVHARPPRLERLQTFFRTPALHFGALDNRLVMDSASLDRPQLTADARLLKTVESLGDSSLSQREPDAAGMHAAVVAQLQQQLESGEVAIRKVARALHMSVRTLQRRLEGEGTSFANLFDQVRQQRAREWVGEQRLPLGEVALRLGFAEFATFSRAFKRWTGLAPGAFRAGSERTNSSP